MAVIAKATVKTRVEHWAGDITTGTHALVTDKPESFGGQDQGPAPYDFICSGLIACTMITLRMYAQHKNLEFGEFTVEADFNTNKEGKEWIERRVHFENELNPELQEKVLNVCSKTPVTKTLLRSLEINTTLV